MKDKTIKMIEECSAHIANKEYEQAIWTFHKVLWTGDAGEVKDVIHHQIAICNINMHRYEDGIARLAHSYDIKENNEIFETALLAYDNLSAAPQNVEFLKKTINYYPDNAHLRYLLNNCYLEKRN